MSSENELRAAAERRRSQQERGLPTDCAEADLIADAYLESQRREAEEGARPVDEAFLVECLGPQKKVYLGCGFSISFYETQPPELEYESGSPHSFYHAHDSVGLPELPNREAFLKLLSVLGVEPKFKENSHDL